MILRKNPGALHIKIKRWKLKHWALFNVKGKEGNRNSSLITGRECRAPPSWMQDGLGNLAWSPSHLDPGESVCYPLILFLSILLNTPNICKFLIKENNETSHLSGFEYLAVLLLSTVPWHMQSLSLTGSVHDPVADGTGAHIPPRVLQSQGSCFLLSWACMNSIRK